MENITNPRDLLIKKELSHTHTNCTCKLKLSGERNVWKIYGDLQRKES